jgi:hypothetical protein
LGFTSCVTSLLEIIGAEGFLAGKGWMGSTFYGELVLNGLDDLLSTNSTVPVISPEALTLTDD